MKRQSKESNESRVVANKCSGRNPNDIKAVQSPQLPRFDYFTPQKLTPSTDYCRIKHSFSQQKSLDPYYLNSRLLELCDFAPNVRERMIIWLMQQASKRYLQRQTCSLSIAYLDLYLMNKGKVSIGAIQELGIACLNLACKLNESCMRPIQASSQLFSQESINNFQIQIVSKMRYRLNPPTYASVAQQLLVNWDQYTKQSEQLKFIQFFPILEVTDNLNSRKMFERVVKFYQLLDCSSAIKQMLEYDVEDFVYNCFYVFLKSQLDLINSQNKENFESSIQTALVQINKQCVISDESLNKAKKILLDQALQKLFEIILASLDKFRTKLPNQNPSKHLNELHEKVPIFSLIQLSGFQFWKPYYNKVVKQSSSQIAHLQQSFQI